MAYERCLHPHRYWFSRRLQIVGATPTMSTSTTRALDLASPRPPCSAYTSSAGAMKQGVGRNSGSSPRHPTPPPPPSSPLPAPGTPGALILTPRSPRLPQPGPASTHPRVVARTSRTAWLHLLSARRSRILNWLFPLLLPFRTSAHRIFCRAFHSGHTLKR